MTKREQDINNEEKMMHELETTSGGFVYRKFLSTEEIKACNRLVKKGKLNKGYPCEKNATVAYFLP